MGNIGYFLLKGRSSLLGVTSNDFILFNSNDVTYLLHPLTVDGNLIRCDCVSKNFKKYSYNACYAELESCKQQEPYNIVLDDANVDAYTIVRDVTNRNCLEYYPSEFDIGTVICPVENYIIPFGQLTVADITYTYFVAECAGDKYSFRLMDYKSVWTICEDEVEQSKETRAVIDAINEIHQIALKNADTIALWIPEAAFCNKHELLTIVMRQINKAVIEQTR